MAAAGGLSRLKGGGIATLTTKLPCDTVLWSIEDNARSVWLYTACGLVRIARTDLDARSERVDVPVGTYLAQAPSGGGWLSLHMAPRRLMLQSTDTAKSERC